MIYKLGITKKEGKNQAHIKGYVSTKALQPN